MFVPLSDSKKVISLNFRFDSLKAFIKRNIFRFTSPSFRVFKFEFGSFFTTLCFQETQTGLRSCSDLAQIDKNTKKLSKRNREGHFCLYQKMIFYLINLTMMAKKIQFSWPKFIFSQGQFAAKLYLPNQFRFYH